MVEFGVWLEIKDKGEGKVKDNFKFFIYFEGSWFLIGI